MSRKSKRTSGVEEAHPFSGMSRIHPYAAGVDIGAIEIVACVPGDESTQISPYPAYAESIVADECAAFPGSDRHHRHDWAKDHSSHPGRRAGSTNIGSVARTRLQEK